MCTDTENNRNITESGVVGSKGGSKGTKGGWRGKKQESEKTELRDRPADRKR